MPQVKVKDALAKLEFLARDRAASERGLYKDDWSGFARRIMEIRVERRLDAQISANYRNTLASAARLDKIDADTEKIVAELCKFDPESPTWRVGTSTAFATEYGGAQFTAQRTRRPWSLYKTISAQLFTQQSNGPRGWPLDIEIICQRTTFPEIGMAISVNRAVVQVSWDADRFTEMAASRAKERAARIAKHEAEWTKNGIEVLAYGDVTCPAWEIRHLTEKAIGIVSIDQATDLLGIEDEAEVVVTLAVYDKDLNSEPSGPAILEDEESPPISLGDGKPLGPNKQRIMQAIAARSLKTISGQQPGSAILARDAVSFRKR